MSSPTRHSPKPHGHSTIVSRGDSPKPEPSGNSLSALPVDSQINSFDLEAVTTKSEEEERKRLSTPGHHHHGTPLERRTSAVREAWPNPELESNPELMKEAIKEERDIFLITFDENDPLDPKASLAVTSRN